MRGEWTSRGPPGDELARGELRRTGLETETGAPLLPPGARHCQSAGSSGARVNNMLRRLSANPTLGRPGLRAHPFGAPVLAHALDASFGHLRLVDRKPPHGASAGPYGCLWSLLKRVVGGRLSAP